MNTERKSSCVKCQIIASNYFHIEWKHMFCCHPRHIKYSNFPVKNWVSFPGPFRTLWLVWCLSKTLLTFVYMCIYTHIEVLIYNSTFSFQYWLKKVNSIKGKKKRKRKKCPSHQASPQQIQRKSSRFQGSHLIGFLWFCSSNPWHCNPLFLLPRQCFHLENVVSFFLFGFHFTKPV